MAARKSCTHMTWSEAKQRSGQGQQFDASHSKKKAVVQVTHAQALTAKIVRKHAAPADYTKAELRRRKRQEEKAAALAAKLAEEREAARKEKEGRTVCPFEVAKERMAREAVRRRERPASSEENHDDANMDLEQVAARREMQLDELMALDAIYADSGEYVLGADADAEGLRGWIDAWHDGGEGSTLAEIRRHPPMSFGLQLVMDDENDVLGGNAGGSDLVATLLLQVTLPLHYPEAALPKMEVAYFAVTDRAAEMSADKALESLVHLEEERLLQGLEEAARQIVPMPCVYELATTWLTDHLFEYCNLRTHAQL